MNIHAKIVRVIAGVVAVFVCCNSAFAGIPAWPKPQKGIKVFSRPLDAVVPTNGVACFTVVAEPSNLSQTLTYQWQKNGTNIAGTDDPSLLLTNVQTSDVGFYTCVVRRGTNGPSIVVKGVDPDLPGAQLFVYTGTNTTVYGPYAPGRGTKSCIGTYVGRTIFKVPGTSNEWFSRPSGTTSATITDISGFTGSYNAKVQVVESYSLWSTCAVHAVTFPTRPPPTYLYQFTIYVTAGAPPSGSTLTLDINWLP
jgi:hypothetical protein